MLLYEIDKPNGKRYLVKALPNRDLPGCYLLWCRERHFWSRWYFVGGSECSASVELAIEFYFGFLAVVHRIQ